MRKGDGVNGDAQRLEQTVWMLFMKLFDSKTVSKRLGHSDTSLNMEIYTHAFEESKNACADRFDKMIKKLEMA